MVTKIDALMPFIKLWTPYLQFFLSRMEEYEGCDVGHDTEIDFEQAWVPEGDTDGMARQDKSVSRSDSPDQGRAESLTRVSTEGPDITCGRDRPGHQCSYRGRATPCLVEQFLDHLLIWVG